MSVNAKEVSTHVPFAYLFFLFECGRGGSEGEGARHCVVNSKITHILILGIGLDLAFNGGSCGGISLKND